MFLNDIVNSVLASSMFALRLLCLHAWLFKKADPGQGFRCYIVDFPTGWVIIQMHVYFVECMFVCVDSLTCCLRGPRGRLAMPNELPSINKDFHFTSLHLTKGILTCSTHNIGYSKNNHP